MSYWPEKASFLLSTSTLLLSDLENTVKNKRLMLYFVLHFQTWVLEFRDEGEDLTAPNAQLESFSLSEHGILPPSTGESSICSAVSPCLLFSASFGQVITAGAIFHLLWCTMKNWPFRIHIVFVFLLWCQLWWMAKLAAVVAELWLHVNPQVHGIMSVVNKGM